MSHPSHDATARKPTTWVPTLYIAQGLPYFAVATVAMQMFKSMGLTNAEIAHWTAFLGAAWIFKPLWSPFLELVSSKKKVVVFFQLAGAVSFGLVGLALHLPLWLGAVIAMLTLAAFSSATHDIACDGLYITTLDAKQQAAYAGWTGTFFNAGRVIAAGGMLLLADHFEKSMGVVPAWTIVFGLIALMMLALGLYNSYALPQAPNLRTEATSAKAIASTLQEVIVDFFRKPGVWVSILFIILFRAGEAQVQTIGPLFLRDAVSAGGLGLSTGQVGKVYGTVGTVAFIVGSIGGGYFVSKLGLKRAILPLILAVNLPNFVFWYLSTFRPDDLTLIAAALGAEMFGYGFGFVGLILYMMQVVAPGRYATAHYAFATGVMQLGQVLFRWISGDIQTALGYQKFFVWVLISAIPVAILSQLIPMTARTPAEGTAADDAALSPAASE
ncbi:MFS transporter [Massilia arenosa]|uniref:MFS transporter n=1 Tax=Zemynaea arenosa TaxID=2561931 RepID=A0A4Y9S6S6_9BURK|nr:MFS transporter [Massilia arenosa]TFW15748.1 MFS transporter [Massilia arenosa]